MRPRVKSSTTPIGRVWWVAWWSGPKFVRTPFWTWPAAIDFAMERVAESQHRNHVHLFPEGGA